MRSFPKSPLKSPALSRGYVSRVFTQVCLPYKNSLLKEPGTRVWERKNGSLSLAVYPGRVLGDDGQYRSEFPSGRIPRLILPWLTSQIVYRQSDRETNGTLPVELGNPKQFAQKIGATWGGKTGKKIIYEAQCLFKARFEVEETIKTRDRISTRGAQYSIAKGWNLFWSPNEISQSDSLMPSVVVMSADFVDDVLACPIPIDLEAMRCLRSPMAMDIYTWLNYRLPAARRSTLIGWELLRWQFGSHNMRSRKFKESFTFALNDVVKVYPDAKVEPMETGLVI